MTARGSQELLSRRGDQLEYAVVNGVAEMVTAHLQARPLLAVKP